MGKKIPPQENLRAGILNSSRRTQSSQRAFRIRKIVPVHYALCALLSSVSFTLCSSGPRGHQDKLTILSASVSRILDSGFRGCL